MSSFRVLTETMVQCEHFCNEIHIYFFYAGDHVLHLYGDTSGSFEPRKQQVVPRDVRVLISNKIRIHQVDWDISKKIRIHLVDWEFSLRWCEDSDAIWAFGSNQVLAKQFDVVEYQNF